MKILRFLQCRIRQSGHSVRCADDGLKAKQALQEERFDLLVLDLGLPLLDGMQVLTWLRTHNRFLPVLLLTARINIEDRVAGLQAGADDYLIKPFDIHELMARIDALLRRSAVHASMPPLSTLVVDGGTGLLLKLDPSTRTGWLGPTDLELTQREWALLHLLVSQLGETVDRHAIAQAWGDTGNGNGNEGGQSSNTTEVYIHRLRRKLEASGLLIRTIRGLGYMMRKS